MLNKSHKTLSILLIVALLGADVSRALQVDALSFGNLFQRKEPISAQGLPPFPEDAEKKIVDWSAIDWDAEVILPKDQSDFDSALKRSQESGRVSDVKEPRKVSMKSDEALHAFQVPFDIAERVRAYGRESKGLTLEKRQIRRQQLDYELKRGEDGSADPKDFMQKPPEQGGVLNVLKAQPLYPKNVVQSEPSIGEEKIDILKNIPQADGPNSLESVTTEGLSKKRLPKSEKKSSALKLRDILSRMFGVSQAHAGTVWAPYYEGIEKYPADALLYSLSLQQNADGSIGSQNVYELSSEIAFLLNEMNRTSNDQYASLINYLTDGKDETVRDTARKARIYTALGKPAQALLDALIATQNEDGGFGLTKNHTSDVITTLEVSQALWAAQYSLQEALPKSLHYALTRIAEDGSIAEGSLKPDYFRASRVAELLFPFRNLTASDGKNVSISVKDKTSTILAFLQAQIAEDGVLKGTNETPDMLWVLRALRLYGVTVPVADKLESKIFSRVESNGTFAVPILSSIAAARVFAKPDFVVTSVTGSQNPRTDAPFSLLITLKNQGTSAGSPKKAHLFIDGGLSEKNINLSGIGSVSPGAIVTVSYNFQSTSTLSQAVTFEVFVEPDNDLRYDNNWQKQTVEFAGSADGMPALPVYFIAHKYDLDGQAGFNIRWSQKADPRRQNYVAMWREKGSQAWNYYGIRDDWNGAFLAGVFTEGMTYEVTAAVLQKGSDSVRYFTNFVTITMSADPKKYTGSADMNVTLDHDPVEKAYIWGNGISERSDENGKATATRIANGTTAAWIELPYYEKYITTFPVSINGTTTDARIFTHVKNDTKPPTVSEVAIRWLMNGTYAKTANEYLLAALGEDETYLKETDFYLWNPSENSWQFISTAKGNVNQSSIYWTIPHTLKGKGFKIRAIARDFAGNETSKESLEFEIVDGVKPAGTVSIEGLTDNAWTLGDKKKITWSFTSPNKLKTIDSIQLHYGGRTEFITSNIDPVSGSFEYTIRKNAVYAEPFSSVSVNVCDEYFTCERIYSDPFDVTDPSPAIQAPWSKESNPNLTLSTYPINRVMDAVFHNEDNSREVIYREEDYTKQNEEGVYRRIVYRKFSNNEWQSPVQLVEYRYKSGETDNVSFQDVNAVRASGGDIHVTFQQSLTRPVSSLADLDTAEMYYLQVSNGALGSRERLSNDDTHSGSARLAVTSKGTVLVSWLEGYKYGSRSGFFTVRYRERVNGAWSAMKQVTTEPSTQADIISQGEDVILMYAINGDYSISKFVRTSGQWTPSTPLITRTIRKAAFTSLNISQDILSLLVENDPERSDHYLWNERISSYSSLKTYLTEKNIASADQILNVWYQNQLAYNSSRVSLFGGTGDDTFDAFYIQSTEQTGWKARLYHVKFKLQGNIASLDSVKTVVPGLNNEIRGFKILKNGQGLFHVFFTRTDNTDAGTFTRPYYLLYDGVSAQFMTRLASLYRYVEDAITGATEQQNRLHVFFNGGTHMNSADMNALSTFGLNPLLPSDGTTAKGYPVSLSWTLSGGEAQSYSLYFGESQDSLAEKASGLTSPSFTLSAIQANTTYYWQIVAKTGSTDVRSSVWTFVSGPPEPEIDLSYDTKSLSLQDSVNIGEVNVGDAKEVTFVISNKGISDLEGIGDVPVRIESDTADEFEVSLPPSFPVKEQSTSTISVLIKPKKGGGKSARLILETNDVDESKFIVNISAISEESKLAMSTSTLENALKPNDTLTLGGVQVGGIATTTIQAWNAGKAPLRISSILFADSDSTTTPSLSAVFSSDPIDPGTSGTVDVAFAPLKKGKRTARMVVASNDPSGEATFILATEGLQAGADLLHNGVSVPRDSDFDMGDVGVGSKKEIIFTVKNIGTAPLFLKGASPVVFSGEAASDFSVGTTTSERILPGAESDIPIVFTPIVRGVKKALMTVATSDPEQSEISIPLVATGTSPGLVVTYARGELQSGDTFILPAQDLGKTSTSTLTIKNVGNADLIFEDIIKPAVLSEFNSSPLPKKLEPRESVDVTISFTPDSMGDRSGSFSLATNDRSNPRFKLSLKGEGKAPLADFSYGKNSITDKKTVLLESVDVGSEKTYKFSLANSGTSDLLVFGPPRVSISGDEQGEFSLVSEPASPVKAGEGTAFVLKFSPKKKGARTVSLALVTNNYRESSFQFTVGVSAVEPEISIFHGTAPLSIGDVVDLKEIRVGDEKTVDLVVVNEGTKDLTFGPLSPFSVTGDKGLEMTITKSLPEKLEPGERAEISIALRASSIGKKQGVITILSDDSDEQTFTIPLVVEAQKPELTLMYKGEVIQLNSAKNLGDIPLGNEQTFEFIIQNTGTASLELNGSPNQLLFTGVSKDDVRAVALPRGALNPNATSTIAIALNTGIRGSKEVTVTIPNSDPDMPNFIFTLLAVVRAPALALFRANEPLMVSRGIVFGNVELSEKATVELEIRNTGNSPLALGSDAFSIAGDSEQEFTVTSKPGAQLQANESGSFVLEFVPKKKGERKAVLTLASNDPTAPKLDVELAGVGIEAEMEISFEGKTVAASSILTLDPVVVSDSRDVSFTIRNNGTADLKLFGPPRVSLSGDTDTFSLSVEPPTPLKPGDESALTIKASPSTGGEKKIRVSLVTNDPRKTSFFIDISLTAIRSQLVMSSREKSFANLSTVSLGETLVGKPITALLSFANKGTSDLTLQLKEPAFEGGQADQFAIDTAFASPLSVGSSTEMQVRFKALKKGPAKTDIVFETNDPDQKDVRLTLDTRAYEPTAVLRVDDSLLEQDGLLSFSTSTIELVKDISVLVENTGDTDLIIDEKSILFTGVNGEEFIAQKVPASIPSNETGMLVLRFTPRTPGEKTAEVRLKTNDPKRQLINLRLRGTATLPIGNGTGLTVEYFAKPDLTGLVRRGTETGIEKDWQFSAPAEGMPKNDFSVRWKGEIDSQYSGTHTFVARADDGVRVWVDGKKIIDLWDENGMKTAQADVRLSQGRRVPLVVEYFDALNTAAVQVTWKNPAGVEEAIPVTQLHPSADPSLEATQVGTGTGLTGEYFNEKDFRTLMMRRTDPTVNFRWGDEAPHAIMAKSGFSVRWSGKLEPRYSGEYKISTVSDDGVRVWIDGKQVINDWKTHVPAMNTASVTLEKGKKVDVKVEYFDETGYATARLYWETPFGIREIIPASQLYPSDVSEIIPSGTGTGTGLTAEYFTDAKLGGMILRRIDPMVNFRWGESAPDSNVPKNGFSVRWSGKLEPRYSGEYKISTVSDDGVRVWIDGKQVINDWKTHVPSTNTASVTLEKGKKVDVKVEYFDETGYATARLYWEAPNGYRELIPQTQLYPTNLPVPIPTAIGSGKGLTAEYFKDKDLKDLAFRRVDKTVDFLWDTGSPDGRVGADGFSVRWSGKVEPRYSGEYLFFVRSDDGFRLTINGNKMEDWTARSMKDYAMSISLEAGKKYDIQLEYFDDLSYAAAQLFWRTPLEITEIIPQTQLYE